MISQAFRRGIGGHHAPNKGATDEWLTPPAIIQRLGHFDLDPCAPVVRPWDTAGAHFSINDGGLTLPWFGRVWLNPPYGQETKWWLEKLADHGDGIALLFARTETRFFQDQAFARATAMLFLRGRINFHRRSTKNAGGPSVLIAYGRGNTERLRGCGLAGHYIHPLGLSLGRAKQE